MKLMINRNIRKILIFIFMFTAIIFLYLIYNESLNPGFKEQKITVYNYSNISSINYSVYMKSNKLYNGNILDEGRLYISEFVDYIDANLKYEFIGDNADNIRSEYSIITKVQGFIVESDEVKNIWEKDFPIILEKEINSYEDKISINEKVKLNLNEYNSFVKDIKETSKINCQVSLTLLMNVNLFGSTDKGSIEDTITTSLIIPLDVAMFEITGNNVVDKPGALEQTVQVQLPVNMNLVVIFGIILAVLLIALIILIFFTQIAPDKAQHEKELNKIFKKHGDRLVALNSDIIIKEPIFVRTINDLVRVADEAGKPILYKYSDDYKEINKFYVTLNEEVFILLLKYSDDVEQVAETEIIMQENTAEQIITETQLNI